MGANDRAADKKRGKRAAVKPTTDRAEWIGFVSCELNAEQRAAAKELLATDMGLAWSEVLGRVERGYKLSVVYDDAHTTWNVSLTCQNPNEENAGYTLSGRGGSFNAALMSLYYRDVYVLKGNWARAALARTNQMSEDDIG